MNGHLRDQAKVSVHCRWPLIRGDLTLKCVGRGIDNVAVQGRWPLTTGVAQGRYYCSHIFPVFSRILTAYKPREHTNGSTSQRGVSRILTANQELTFCRMNNKVFSGYSSSHIFSVFGRFFGISDKSCKKKFRMLSNNAMHHVRR